MIVSISQPAYLPWLGYFDRIAASDLHIVLDDVQFERRSFTNRNKVRTAEGSTLLTVPVMRTGNFHAPIHELEIDETQKWRHKHWQTIQRSYGRAAYFATHEAFFEDLYAATWPKLLDLCRHITAYLMASVGISTEIRFSSELPGEGVKDDLILRLCRDVGATKYISGPLGRDYLREDLFHAAGIEVVYHDYQHPEYRQLYEPFMPFMAAIDLLFTHGPQSRAILTNGRGVAH